jgi:hypothetical protein
MLDFIYVNIKNRDNHHVHRVTRLVYFYMYHLWFIDIFEQFKLLVCIQLVRQYLPCQDYTQL